MKWKAVLFDLDGTIFDTERMYKEVTMQAGRECGIDIDDEFYKHFVGLRWDECQQLILERFGPDVPLPRLNQRTRELIQAYRLELKPGVFELLDFLDSVATPYAVATSTKTSKAIERLSSVGLLERFVSVTGGDMIARAKPAPDIYLHSADSVGKAPSECLAIEDSTVGARASIAAGIATIFIPDLIAPDQASSRQCVSVLPSLNDVISFLLE